ncbi:MAG: hypothetical protein K0S68_356 [Candidatus Saccharibacteria bacterium]|jgi:hypothetical protein|nr:hypothetical protein [Candidatus Saccharibacteria bacterium]
MKTPAMQNITTSIKKNLRYKPAVSVRPRFYDLSIDDQTQSTAVDTIANAVRLYTTMRTLWRKGTPAEDGVCYVKVKDQFVEIKLNRSKF